MWGHPQMEKNNKENQVRKGQAREGLVEKTLN